MAAEPLSAVWDLPALSPLINEGLRNNNEILSAASRAESLKDEIPFAASLDDPHLGFGVANLPVDTFSFNQEAMTQKQIFVAQKFPWFGKLRLRKQKAALGAKRQLLVLEAKRLELAGRIATIFFDLGFLENSLSVNEKLSQKLRQLSMAAEVNYSTGRGLQQDVLQAQVEHTRLLNEKIELRRRKRTLQLRLLELLNREGPGLADFPENFDLPEITLDVDSLKQSVLRLNPEIRIKRLDIGQARLDVELSQKNYLPDMDVKLSYGQRDANQAGQDWADFVSAGVTMNIPLWQGKRQDSKLAAARSAYQAARQSYQNLYATMPYKIDALVTEIDANRENYNLFAKGLLLQAQQANNSTMAAYEVGKVEFNTMMATEIRLLDFELKKKKYLFTVYKKWAQLAELAGVPVKLNEPAPASVTTEK